jgi:hypothetical protein
MLNLQLFIGSQRVDFFNDESVVLNDSIQDARDPAKIFTAVSRDFTVPASLINNNLFKHFSNFDIVDGFDPRQKVSASLFQNGFLYKKGFIQLRSVNLENNKAASYVIFFTGLLGELKDIFKSDKLSDISQLSVYSHPYNIVTIRAGLQNYFNVVNNVAVFAGATISDMCYPFVSSVNRYAFGAFGLRTVDADGVLTSNKIQTSDLKPALRATRIIEAIELKYNITFDSTFLKSNTKFTEVFLWLNRTKGVLADSETFDIEFLITDFSKDADGSDAVLDLTSNFITTKLDNREEFDNFTDVNLEYKIDVTGSGLIELQLIDDVTNQVFIQFSKEVEDEEVSIAFLFQSTEQGSTQFKPSLRIITETEDITQLAITLIAKETVREFGNASVQIGNYTLTTSPIVAISDVNVPLQIPSMLILDFLTSIFKTFNLTAFVQNDGSIKVQPLDDYYASGKTIDITNQIDISKSEVKRFEPFKDINFEFEEPESFLMVNRNKILDDDFGNLNFQVGEEDPTKVISGGEYNVKPKFHKILPERLRLSSGALSPIMFSWYVNEDSEPLSNQPILFYTKRNAFSASDTIQFQNNANLSSNIAPSNVKGDLQQTLNFGAEIDEFTLAINKQSLFNLFYRNFILRAFSLKSKILRVKAYLDASFILNYELNDTFIINGRKFNINTLDVNLNTGEANIELRNVFPIAAIPTQEVPVDNQLTISSPSQTENDVNGSYTFTIFSNVTWAVTEASSFISVSPASGSNNATITVTYTENTTTDSRSGVVTVIGGGFTRLHTLTQTGKAVALTIDIATKTQPKELGNYNIVITSNSDWNVVKNQPWVNPNTFSGSGNATLNIEHDANLSTDERNAIIDISAGTITRTHTLTQEAQASTSLFEQSMTTGSTKVDACNSFSFQNYYTDDATFVDSTVIFFDEFGNNRVGQGFFRQENLVLETDTNGEVIDNTQTCS